MRDYASLVQAYRYCAEGKPCKECPMYLNCPDIHHQTVAADAIEELLEDNAALNGAVANLLATIQSIAEYVIEYPDDDDEAKAQVICRKLYYTRSGPCRKTVNTGCCPRRRRRMRNEN